MDVITSETVDVGAISETVTPPLLPAESAMGAPFYGLVRVVLACNGLLVRFIPELTHRLAALINASSPIPAQFRPAPVETCVCMH
jgi:hypothetical protein